MLNKRVFFLATESLGLCFQNSALLIGGSSPSKAHARASAHFSRSRVSRCRLCACANPRLHFRFPSATTTLSWTLTPSWSVTLTSMTSSCVTICWTSSAEGNKSAVHMIVSARTHANTHAHTDIQ